MSSCSLSAAKFVLVAASSLFVSQPDPRMFGNPREQNLEGWSNANWLKSMFHFSFAEYHDRRRENFGPVRVLNDDLVQPKRGFGAHPHREMEIVTYIVHGHLSHKDSMGSMEALGRGAVQYMSAGTGVTHSEHNLGDVPLRFLQIWIVPRRRGLKPNYGSHVVDPELRNGKWTTIVDDVESSRAAPVRINQDVSIRAAEFTKEQGKLILDVPAGRQAYVVCVEGAVSGTPTDMRKHDAAKIFGPAMFELTSIGTDENAHLLVLEMAADASADC